MNKSMAKNELLEDILDDLSVMKEKDEARDQRLDRIEAALGELVKAAGSTQPTTSTTQAESTNSISYNALKEAVYDAITEYHEAKPEHTGIFTEDNIRKLHSVINKADGEWLKKHWAKQDEEAKKERDLLASKRTAQGIQTTSMVAEWAPEYSPEIQRTIRFIGLKTLDEDEPAEKAHAILKVWGDALSRITAPPPPEPPSLMAWLKYKGQQVKVFLRNRRAISYTLLLMGGLATMICLSFYQSAVMDLDRTNRIFYHYVIKNANATKDYHELDSLIHTKDFFKTYRTLEH